MAEQTDVVGAEGIHAEVSRITLTGQTNELQVEHGNRGWRLLSGTSVLSQRAWETQQEAMEVAIEWIRLNDYADALQAQAGEHTAAASRLVATPVETEEV